MDDPPNILLGFYDPSGLFHPCSDGSLALSYWCYKKFGTPASWFYGTADRSKCCDQCWLAATFRTRVKAPKFSAKFRGLPPRDATTGREPKTARRGRFSVPVSSTQDAEWLKAVSVLGRSCLKCGATESITRDHVIPLSRGGLHTITNLQPLCVSCNRRKGSDDGDYRTARQISALQSWTPRVLIDPRLTVG